MTHLGIKMHVQQRQVAGEEVKETRIGGVRSRETLNHSRDLCQLYGSDTISTISAILNDSHGSSQGVATQISGPRRLLCRCLGKDHPGKTSLSRVPLGMGV